MLHCLRPDINIDDHLDISIQPNEDYTFWDENDEEISVAEYYEQKFREWSADKSNEYILAHLEDFHNELIGTLADEYHDRPGTLELKIDAKTELGESLRKSIFGILYAFEYDDIYT